MNPAWLLALLVLGIGPVVNTVLGVLRRDRERGSLVGAGRREGRTEARGDVAVVIGAHDAETEIADAVAAALRLVHRGDVHVVADDSTDKTAEIARGLGVNVVETVKPLGRSGSLVAALDGFALTENYAYVLVLDVDHRPHPAYLDRTLPIFDDPDVVAVAGFARTDWTTARRTPIGRVLTAYRARSHMLAQALLTIIRTRPNGEAARWLPSPARMFRTSVLTRLDLAPDGVPIADFDVSNQVYRADLGRIVVVRGAVVGTRDPDKLVPYVRQTRQWAVGFWQAVRRNGLRTGPQRLGLGWFAVESTVTAAVFVALPFLLGFGVLSIWTVLLGVFVPDLLMTALVALRQRQPRFVLPALFLPFVRLLDSVIFLSALPDAFVDRKASARWLSPVRAGKAEPATAPNPARWRATLLALSWLAAVGAVVLLVLRVAAATVRLPATATEPALVDAVFGRVAGFPATIGEGLLPTVSQLAAYASAADAFDRHATVLAGVRELSIGCAAVIALAGLVAAAVLRLHPAAIAVALALAALCPPVVGALAVSGSGPLAAAWLALTTVPLALSTRVGWKVAPLAVLPAAGAVVTVPALVLPFAVATASWWVADRVRMREGRRVVVAVAVLVAGGALAALLAVLGLFAVPEDAGSAVRGWLVLAVAAVAAGGLVRGRARTGSAGLLAVVGVVALTGSDALLACGLAGSVLVLAALIDGAVAESVAIRRAVAGASAAAGVALGVAGLGSALPVAVPVDHRGAVDWFLASAAPGSTLSAPPLLLSDLRRDLRGRQPQLIRPETTLSSYSVRRGDGAGTAVAWFDGLTVRLAQTAPATGPDRAGAGARLAENPRVRTTDEVKAVLRAGELDFRAMAVLAEISAQHDLVVVGVGNAAAERGSGLPARTVTVSHVDGNTAAAPAVVEALRSWVQVQQSPYAPMDVRPSPDGTVALVWRIPTPDERAPR
ncbi:glycosyltransferase [Actinokineospora pegani]|uniref:glycosyltransferase n=1 Tax=Actinokineospora pegani TaxID=2654637 RepID=UPI0012EA0DB4|nr:glycosyltransferase family 2 protein [Actinokineospora pegani]